MKRPDWYRIPGGPRPPDWRWRRALADAQTHRLRLRTDVDELTRLLTKCVFELRYPTGPHAQERSYMIRHTSVFVEILAWRENRSIAAKLEALLLADMPLDYVTSQINASPVNVELYRQCFF